MIFDILELPTFQNMAYVGSFRYLYLCLCLHVDSGSHETKDISAYIYINTWYLIFNIFLFELLVSFSLSHDGRHFPFLAIFHMRGLT